ncbi:hypothetical protein C8R45DRAFT_1179112 [Mycena sanguinolenta]|nr:hypothetical protein C8R45DRAFT_1179112 [Mycena sanguinolenta]
MLLLPNSSYCIPTTLLPSVNPLPNSLLRPDPDKVVRQKADFITNNTVSLAVYHSKGQQPLQLQLQVESYPQTRLSAHPNVMHGLQINETSWFDLYSTLAWKTMQASTFFLVDKNASTLIRLRPSLLVELVLTDCPGIDEFIGKQSRKRAGTDLVSPPKKTLRTNAVSAPSQAREIIEIPDSPPMTFSSVVPIVPSTSHAPIPSLPQLLSQLSEEKFPDAFYACEHDAGWKGYAALCDNTSRKSNIPDIFPTLFPGAKYKHTTVTLWRNFFLNAPSHVRQHYVAFGRTENGSWKAFVAGVRAVAKGDPLPSLNQTVVNLAIKSEPEPSSIPKLVLALDTPIPNVPNATAVPTPIASAPNSHTAPSTVTRDAVVPADFGRCDFCDTPFTIIPSAKLAQLLPESESAPTADIIPTLQDILENVAESDFFQAAVLDNEAFNKATGYFGELGYHNISATVRDLFPECTITIDFAPLSWNSLMEQVLIPEAIICLIREELDATDDLTGTILKDSTPFGLAYHSDAREEPPPSLPEAPLSIGMQVTSFPALSPLLLPHELSPPLLLQPATWEECQHRAYSGFW